MNLTWTTRWTEPQVDTWQEPPSFDMTYRDAWARWVLDHGLSAPPEESLETDMVPVAYWAGTERGVVFFVGGCDHDPLCEPPEPPHRVPWSHAYIRDLAQDGRWEGEESWGGSRWAGGLGFQLRDVGPPRVNGPYGDGDDRATFVVHGRADTEVVKFVEVRQGRVRSRQPMPVSGVFVIGVDGRHPGTVRFLDQDGNKVADKRFRRWQDDLPDDWKVPRPSADW